MNFNTKFVIAKCCVFKDKFFAIEYFNTKFVIAKCGRVCYASASYGKFQYKICYSKIQGWRI